jgi:hypothetical protein
MSSKKRKKDEGVSPWISLPLLCVVVSFILYLGVYRPLRDFKIETLESESVKTRFQNTFEGLDQNGPLTVSQREWVVETANKEKCSCGCGYTLAACIRTDDACPWRSKNLDHVKELIGMATGKHKTG